jgi:hypothetical protein
VPTTLGTLTPAAGPTTTFVATGAGSGRVTAVATGAAGSLSASAAVTVAPVAMRVSSIAYRVTRAGVLVTAKVVDVTGRPVRVADVTIHVLRSGATYYARRATTGVKGRAVYRLRLGPGCYRTAVTRVAARGYRWNRKTPANRFCR